MNDTGDAPAEGGKGSDPVAASEPAKRGGVARARIAREWWSGLQPAGAEGNPNHFADRGALARLRRASSPLDVLDEEAVFDLYRRLGFLRDYYHQTLVTVAVTASVLARVRVDDPTMKVASEAGRICSKSQGREARVLSPGRLRRLLAARDPDEVHRQMRRLVDLCGPRLDVGGLAVLILDWFDEDRGRSARSRFAYDYYAARGTLPGGPSDTTREPAADADPPSPPA